MALNIESKDRKDKQNYERIVYNPTESKYIQWKIYHSSSGPMGMIRVKEFEYDVPLRKAILIIRSLLLNQFKETNGVLFDVRDSPGGTIHYAATLVQLFKGESSHVYDRYRRNNVTDEIIKQRYAENSSVYETYFQTLPGTLSGPIYRSSYIANLQEFGAVYLRPVGILMDAYCYSSCDRFAAEMQDNQVATIFGEDKFTGGAGSVVGEHIAFVEELPAFFDYLPMEKEGFLVIDMPFSLGIRPSGQIIEDYGVQADKVIRPSVSDLLNPDGRTSQLDEIASILSKDIEVKRRRFYTLEDYFIRCRDDSPVTLRFEAENLSNLEVYAVYTNKKEFLASQRFKFFSVKNYTLTTRLDSSKIPSSKALKIVFVGFDQFGKRFFDSNRLLQVLPKLDQYLSLNKQPFIWDFKDMSNTRIFDFRMGTKGPQGGFDSMGKIGSQWKFDSKTKMLFVPADYRPDAECSLTFAFKALSAIKAVKVEAKIVYDIEDGYDFADITYTSSLMFNPVSLLPGGKKITGKGTLKLDTTYSISDPEFEINFWFTSDDWGNDVPVNGVNITEIIVTPL